MHTHTHTYAEAKWERDTHAHACRGGNAKCMHATTSSLWNNK